jgi:hypothetical protein
MKYGRGEEEVFERPDKGSSSREEEEKGERSLVVRVQLEQCDRWESRDMTIVLGSDRGKKN